MTRPRCAVLERVEQRLRGLAPDRVGVDPHRRQRRLDLARERDVVEPGDRQLRGHVDAERLRLEQRAQCERVVAADHGRRPRGRVAVGDRAQARPPERDRGRAFVLMDGAHGEPRAASVS